MPRIDAVRIHNFRGASSPLTIAFAQHKPLVVIFGENGTGKTTIVDALDAVGNDSGGSLATKSSTTLRTHLPTLGKKPADIVLEVSSGTTTWTATLGRTGIVTAPAPGPPIRVLRRTNLQRFIDSPPGDRYKELRHLIGVERVEKSEEALKRALDNAKRQFDEAVQTRSDAEDRLRNIWDAEGRPGASWTIWASEAAATDAGRLTTGVHRSRATREAIETALRARDDWHRAEANAVDRRHVLAAVEHEIAAAPALGATAAIGIAELLGNAREQLAAGDHDDRCPVCGQEIPLADLRRSIDERLTELARYTEFSNRRREARRRLETDQTVAEHARHHVVAAATRVWTIARDAPDGFAPLDLPDDALAAFAEGAGNGTRPEVAAAHAAELIAAGEPVVAALQADEEAGLHAAGRLNAIRELSARAEQSRATTVELERIVAGLAAAHDVARRARIEFTQRILDDVAAECNRLYAEIHPNEGIAIAKIELDRLKRASITQAMDFAGHTDLAPQAYLSEAHLDTFGFCFWLAFAKREHPDGDAVLVLDDVFSSVDAPHLGRITDLIVQERAHFAQTIITTHQRAWRNAFRNSYGPGKLADLIELQSWSLAGGIFSYQTPLAIEDLRRALVAAPFDRQAVAASAGILLEATLDRLTFLYRCPVPRTRENVYTLGELLDATGKLFKKLELNKPVRDAAGQVSTPLAFDATSPAALVNGLRQSLYVRNQVGAHHNDGGMGVADAEVRAFATLAAQLVETLVCDTCGQIPSKSTGEHWRCSCAPDRALRMAPLNLV